MFTTNITHLFLNSVRLRTQSCPGCLSQLSCSTCPDCPVMAVSPYSSCPGCPVPAVLYIVTTSQWSPMHGVSNLHGREYFHIEFHRYVYVIYIPPTEIICRAMLAPQSPTVTFMPSLQPGGE